MSNCTHEELALIDDLINLVLKKDKNSKLVDESYHSVKGDRSNDYITEQIIKEIFFKDTNFSFYFYKHYIDINPKEKYENSTVRKVSDFFGGIIATGYDAYTLNLRRDFQGELKPTFDSNDMNIWDKEKVVTGFTVAVHITDSPVPLEFESSKMDKYKIYIQTNNMSEAKKNTRGVFFKRIISSINKELNK